MGVIPGGYARKLEQWTGGVVGRVPLTACTWRLGNVIPGDSLAFFFKHSDEQVACINLRQQNWKRVTSNVFAAQEWKCYDCGQRKPLQGDHFPISKGQWRPHHGPLDIESNVRGRCAECHKVRHGGGA